MKNPTHNSRRALLGALLITTACLCRSQAANLLVYNTNNSGAGSLRQAIADNTALGGGNTIIFSNVVAGTITLTSGELLITKNVTILGPGANVLAVNGNFPNTTNRVFHINNVTNVAWYRLGENDPGAASGSVANSTVGDNPAFGFNRKAFSS